MATKPKSNRQLLDDLTWDRCDGCGEKQQVIHYNRRTRTGSVRRSKRCTACYTGR